MTGQCPGAAPPPSPQSWSTTSPTGDPVQNHWTSGGAIFGGFVAFIACGILTLLQFLSAVLGLAFDSSSRPQNASELRYNDIFMTLFTTTPLAGLLTLVAFFIAIFAAVNRRRRIVGWVVVPLVINLVLCAATWLTGLASIPPPSGR